MKGFLFSAAVAGVILFDAARAEAGGPRYRGAYTHPAASYGHGSHYHYGHGGQFGDYGGYYPRPHVSYYGGYGSGWGGGYGGHHHWHDTSHYDYHPGEFVPHRNHYHYVPGHYDFHPEGHWDHHH